MSESTPRRFGRRQRADRRWSTISATLFIVLAFVVLMLLIVVDLKG